MIAFLAEPLLGVRLAPVAHARTDQARVLGALPRRELRTAVVGAEPVPDAGRYSIAFGSVFKKPMAAAGRRRADYTLILFVGLIVHGFFTECLTRAPTLVVGNPSYVKRVVFPLEVLPWPMVFSAFFHLLMNLAVLLFIYVLRHGIPSATVLLFPLVVLPLALVGVGTGWLLASLGVYLRDIAQVTGVLSAAMLFLSSAVVPVDTLPAKCQFVFRLNPLSFIIDQSRNVALWGQWPDWQGLALYAGGALIFCYLAYAWFRAIRSGFADVL